MQNLYLFVQDHMIWCIIGTTFISFLLLSLIIVLWILNLSLKKRVNRFFGSKSNRHNIESALIEYLAKIDSANKKFDGIIASLENINHRLSFCIQKVGVVRYNPYDNKGSDLSFTLALLDERDNGVVMNTIHGRDSSYTYAKPILGGQSAYALSDEEIEAIELAMEKGDKQMSQYYSKL